MSGGTESAEAWSMGAAQKGGRGPQPPLLTTIPSDLELMERVRTGDAAALTQLMQRYWKRITEYGASILSNADDGEDVAQETFVNLWKNRSSWSPSGTVSGYIYRVARNVALNRKRGEGARRKRETDSDLFLSRSGSLAKTPETDLRAKLASAQVRRAIDALPRRRREIFLLARFHDLTHAEIAETTGLSPQTVANQMSLALTDLRKALGGLLR